jgi:hypothetical protein
MDLNFNVIIAGITNANRAAHQGKFASVPEAQAA